ncbi:LOW QUALITY PROTEIN: phosphorylase b kinase regulatory subunit beta-like [Haliotis rubra]|uniref:LOW QUALITY PROTEIN: phosphorylase b kinase regulatory subunit beta-like n=1 Tax=Haliotis rubra TaxID=36100 RepID=UPI001EE5AFAF|nr:LOW QUALITY PROTEIN: phosphorylase b kinase regulatory subunit beta-like [Haliotis rubra]
MNNLRTRLRLDNRLGLKRVAMEEAENNHDQMVKKLDDYYTMMKRQILQYQSCPLGLFPTIGSKDNQSREANVRDSIYCAVAAWSLSQAYRRIDDDQGKTHELGQIAVKCMRGILFCWIRQADKVEKFKSNQNPVFALHSMFDIITGDPIYADDDYEHLQIDAVALYLIFLIQMISSGCQLIFTTDEVNFVQNMVFYVERAYRTPDYGMWERGSKYNNGSTEIHASSIGMAKAALEAVNGNNVYGEQGAAWSVIYVDIDAHNRNRTIFETILPRESNSKNTDASLLPTVCWPAFAIHEEPVKRNTVNKVIRKLNGKYGIKRFFRDGYKTELEDKNRKYYRPAEIKNFDGIESEWPIFYLFIMIDCIFHGDKEGAEKYQKLLKPLLVESPDGLLIPRYYYVPADKIDLEKSKPGSQKRLASPEGSTDGIFMWGQAVYLISQLLTDGLLNVNELDPIRRYLPALERPKFSARYSKFQGTPPDLIIQIVLIAESTRLQQLLATYGIQTQTPHQIEPIQIWSPKELTKAYEYLGINKKLGLTGRPSRPFGVLSTSKIYRACSKTILCYPLLFELSDFYLAQDISLVMDDCKNDLAFLSKRWKLSGRLTWCMVIRENSISKLQRGHNFGEFLDLLSQFKKGSVDGIRVSLGRLQSFISSACIEHLDFLHTLIDPGIFTKFEEKTVGSNFKSLTDIPSLIDIVEDGHVNKKDLVPRSTYDLCQMLKAVSGLTIQSQILEILYEREGPLYRTEGQTVEERLERLVQKAGAHKHWSVVRLCSALLGKLVDSLAPSVTTVLVRGKQITVGVFGHEEEVLDKPVGPNEIKTIIYGKCLPYDIRQAVLQQELILCLGKIIATSSELFDGILKVRIGWFVRAIEVEMEQDKGSAFDIHAISPHQVKEMMLTVLTRNTSEADIRTPFQKRQLDGALNRVPKDFYDRVWEILERTPGGIKVAGYLLPQQPTLSDMTMYELNFSLLVEQMLSKIVDPSYRQIMVEAFMVVSIILERNPELMFQQAVNMDKIIQEAYDEFQRDLNKSEGREKQDDMRCFFNTAPNVKHGTTGYIGKAVMRTLLDGDLRVTMEDMCCVS